MAEVKWIKLTTSMFEDEKIDYIESMPDADAVLIIWIKLLTLAGKCNANGFIFLTENIPYTAEMISHKFRRPLNTVKMALNILQKLDMISVDGAICITNWEKHQNIEGLEKIREQTRLRNIKYRDKKKLSAPHDVIVTSHDATEVEVEVDKDTYLPTTRENFFQSVIKAWNGIGLSKIKEITDARADGLRALLTKYSQAEVIQAIESIEGSSYLTGKKNGRKTNFDWVISNFAGLIEGKYHDEEDDLDDLFRKRAT